MTTCNAADAPSAAGRCLPCAEDPTPYRLDELRTTLADQTEPLLAVAALLRQCRDDYRTLWERHTEASSRERAAQVRQELSALIDQHRTSSRLEGPVRDALVRTLRPDPDVPAVVVARVLADLLDEGWAAAFPASFAARSPYTPAVGDPVPLGSPDLPSLLQMAPTSPPWRLAQRLDETRHVRLAGEWAARFRVVFDYAHADALAGIVDGGTTIAVVSPNASLSQFGLGTADEPAFPVLPVDPERQRRLVLELVAQAGAAGASIIVLPELAVPPELADELQDVVGRPGGVRLIVAGAHHRVDADGGRHNTAVAWLRGSAVPLRQDKHSPADSPVVEDLRHAGWPEIRIHVSSDGWHVALAVCRDLLNPSAVQALAEGGVHLLLVPAMSETLLPFGGPAAHLVGATQALVAVANGPADWGPGRRAAPGLFGHPGLIGQTRLVHRHGSLPGIALMDVDTALVRWRDAPEVTERQVSAGQPERPSWLDTVAALVRQPNAPDPSLCPGWLRPAAVLVLLSDSPDGAQVLVTRRSAQLRTHPGAWVLPGGRVEPEDEGEVAAALREAAEEVGIDRQRLHVLGTLPGMALTVEGWLVTPVLAWSGRPLATSAQPAEVSDAEHVPLQALAPSWSGAGGGHLGPATALILGQLRGVLSPASPAAMA